MGRPLRERVVPLSTVRTGRELLSDEALVAACALGEQAALAALFDRLQVRLFGFISRLVGSHGPDVDDLVQATFLEVWRSAPRFRGRSPAVTWILGIAANLGRRHVRTETRRIRAVADLSNSDEIGTEDAATGAERRQLVERMAEAMGGLSHELRTAFLLCELEGLSGVDAARAVGVRPGTMWKRLHLARKALRACLEGLS
jgi:RNA polymerase sigma factor (sigma-70 family)